MSEDVFHRVKGFSVFRRETILVCLMTIIFILSSAVSFASLQMPGFTGSTLQGTPLTISPEWTQEPVEYIRVYYRPEGSKAYQQMDIQPPADGILSFNLPAHSVAAPGVEFYIEIKTVSGEVMTSPPVYPGYNPHRIEVGKPAQTRFSLVSPVPDTSLEKDAPFQVFIKADNPRAWKPDEYALLVDGVNVTGAAEISRKGVLYRPHKDPLPGKHSIELVGRSPSGEAVRSGWTFDVPGEAEGKREAYTRGGLSFNYGSPVLERRAGTAKEQVSGNLNLAFGLRSEDMEFSWQGVNIQYIKDSAEGEVTISSGFSFIARRWGQMLEYGDITVKETPMTAPSFARRGAQMKLHALDTDVRLFDVRSDTVSGFSSGLTGGNERQVYGASISRALLPNDGLKTTLVYITGENRAVSGFNTGSTQSPGKGNVLGAALVHRLSRGIGFNGEIASSRFDRDTADSTGPQSGVSGAGSLSAGILSLNAGLGYQYSHPDYASIANPNFTSDREGYNGSLGGSIGPSSLSLSLSSTRDNVTDDPAKPVVYSTSGTLSYGLTVQGWPSTNIAYSRSIQDSRKEPAGSTGVRNTNDNVNGSMSYGGEGWSSALSAGWGYLNDELQGNDSLIRNYSLSGNYSPSKILNTNGSAGLTETRTGGVLKQTWLYSVTGGVPVLAPYGNTGFQVSYSMNTASDNSQESANLNGSWRISMNLHEFTKQWVDYGQEVLALSFNYSRVEDEIIPANTREDYSGFLTVNLYAPLNSKYDF